MALVILALGSCGYIPRPVEGVPPGAPWEALPLRKWLAEDRAEPEALAFCAPPECSPGLVVSVLRLTGKDAREAEAVLDDPATLARFLRSRPGKPPSGKAKPVQTLVTTKPLQDSPYRGFAISLAPADGRKAPAYGAALGLRSEDALRVVLVIGEDEMSVQTAVRRVAERELRP
ncbi:hypothetical protein [Microvirga sp. 2TAF3]|uniref:hypothetical protein n=1 Tax=Microvirga sp. 2TAF3 TaxID=3233014 RepID=UPI003F9D699D